MSLETDVQNLTAATTNLLNAVNISKATLDSKVTDATTQATNSANSATASASSASASASSAASALNIYGNTAAMNTAVSSASTSATNAATSATNASNSATQAAASAASASQIVLGVASGLPNVLPSLNLDFANSKTVDPRITFSRASTATFYDGKTTAKAEENLLTYSQEFDNGVWQKQNTSVTANTAMAPDGTTTADSLLESASTAFHLMYRSYTDQTLSTFSFYAKSNGRDWIQVAIGGSYGGASAFFNVSTGTLGTVVGNITAAISSAGNGWYRCSVTKTSVATSSGSFDIYLSTNGTQLNYAGDGVSGVYIWGAQLEQRSSVTAYTPTTTQPITNYIPALQTAAAGVPRIDHDPITGECKGLLIEEQRTNLVVRSEEFSTASWTKAYVSVTPDATIAPSGNMTADRVVNTPNQNSYFLQNVVLANSTSYTKSIYVKVAPDNTAPVFISTCDKGAGEITTSFNLSTLAITGADAATSSITHVGNGWYRLSHTFTTLGSGTRGAGVFYLGAYGSTTGTASFYIWGAQLEAGAFPTSYIKTEASQVTRSVDVASMTGANFYSWNRADEGSIFAEWGHIATNPGSSPANQYPNVLAFSATRITSYGSSVDGIIGSTENYFFQSVAVKKISAAYSGISSQIVTDGVLRNSFGSKSIPQGDKFLIGNSGGGNVLNGHIKKVAYYPKRLSNSELQALTAV